jgi:hypothetical protein
MPVNLEKIISEVPWNDVLDIADEALDEDSDQDVVLTKIAETVDNLIDFGGMGEVGKMVELVDEQIFRAVARVIISLAGDPERRAERREKRKKRRAERKISRAEKKKK